jgi:hypothetical protein
VHAPQQQHCQRDDDDRRGFGQPGCAGKGRMALLSGFIDVD